MDKLGGVAAQPRMGGWGVVGGRAPRGGFEVDCETDLKCNEIPSDSPSLDVFVSGRSVR